MKQFKLPELISPKSSHFHRLVFGTMAARMAKLASSSMLDVCTAASTLNEEFRLKCVDEEDLFSAVDKLVNTIQLLGAVWPTGISRKGDDAL